MPTYTRLILATLLILAAVSFSGLVNAAPTPSTCENLVWEPVTTDTDGKALTADGYVLYFGQTSGEYSDSAEAGDVTRFSIVNLLPNVDGRYYIAITAKHGWDESAYSNEVMIDMIDGVPTRVGLPAAPGTLRLECVIVQ